MNNHIMAICDEEAEYAYHLVEYLNGKKTVPFQIQVFTEPEQLYSYCKKNRLEVLVVAEASYSEEMKKLPVHHTVILADRGELQIDDVLTIRKYQSSEKIIKEILYDYSKKGGGGQLRIQNAQAVKLIGIYTPVGRCLQTSFALLLGQLLAEENKVLYLNFEPFSGFGKFIKKEFSSDLTDLMYFMNNLESEFAAQFGRVVESIQGLDYIPPAFSFVDLSSISGEEWKRLTEQIIQDCDYDYILLDLSDSIRGLFEILKACDRVYTISKEDGVAMAKINQYETLLRTMEYEDVLEKTKRFEFPLFKNIPMEVEQLPFCELAKYVRSIIREDKLNESL